MHVNKMKDKCLITRMLSLLVSAATSSLDLIIQRQENHFERRQGGAGSSNDSFDIALDSYAFWNAL